MATKVQAIKFGSINRASLKMKNAQDRTRTGAYKHGRKKAHGKHYKHR